MLNFMKSSIFFITILILNLQGCSGGGDSSTTYPRTLGTSISVNSTDENAVMVINPNTIKIISKEVSSIVKSELISFNEKVTIIPEKEMRYCDISGLRESQNIGTLTKIINTKNYENCKEEKTLQHGKIVIDYSQMDTEGNYPKSFYLTVKEDYTFDNIELKKEVTVEGSITYNQDKSIKKIMLKIDGEIRLDSINYGLLNIENTIEY